MIKLEKIEIIYEQGKETEIRALSIPSLEITTGCWCNIIGPNGSGKTTLLKALSGSIEMSGGNIYINNQNITKWKARHVAKLVQLLEQSPEKNTVPSMTIEENLRLYSYNRRFSSLSSIDSGSLDEIKNLLAQFEMDLENRLSTQVGLLSGGQKQAVALAAVLLRNPRVLLLDEFLASIDPNATPKLLTVVQDVASRKGITVLMVSHDLMHVEATGDRLLILSNGHIADDTLTSDHILLRSEIVKRYSTILEKNGIL